MAGPTTRAEWLSGLSRATAAELVAVAATMPSPERQIVLHQMGGAAARVPAAATAFSRRDAAFMILVNAAWTPGGDPTPHQQWVHSTWRGVGGDSAGGAYVNHLAEEGGDRVRAAYGEQTYRRLALLKARFDPGNLLHRNQNIRPVPSGSQGT